MSATVIFGPLTRLGRAVRSAHYGPDCLAVARNARDVAALTADGVAPTSIVDASEAELSARVAALGDGPLRIVIAALGPVHPTEPDFAADYASVQRDLTWLEQVLGVGRPAHVVLVSTVISLAPGKGRRYYGGWKSLLEELVQQRVTAAGREACITVLHPGRLRDASEGGMPWRRVHASYDQLASVALDAGLAPKARQPIGADSRIWLALKSISFAGASLGI